jgi:hypothetical protein
VTDATTPFANYAELNSELGYLIYLVRSTEVWGVSSRLAGPFDEKKHATILSTCERLVAFLRAPTLQVDIKDGHSKMVDLTAASALEMLSGLGGGIQLGNLGGLRGGSTAGGASVTMSGSVGLDKEGDEDGEGPFSSLITKPNPEHQDILRAMNLQLPLVTAIGLDYNISFRGSVCSFEEMVRSRSLIVSAVRRMVEVLVEFVSGNPENQRLVFTSLSLDDLLNGLGDLEVPTSSSLSLQDAKLLETAPGLNLEEVVIECLRGNAYLCSEKVPKELVLEFGRLLDKQPDCSDSPLVEFFAILCEPEGGGSGGVGSSSSISDGKGEAVVRNQELVVDVFLGQNSAEPLPNLTRSLMGCFGLDSDMTLPARPEAIVSLLCRCVSHGNNVNAARLQAHGLTMEVTVEALASMVEETFELFEERGMREKAFLESAQFMTMLVFASLQAQALVIDPRLFVRSDFWRVMCDGASLVLTGFVKDLEEAEASNFLNVGNKNALSAAAVFMPSVLSLFMALIGTAKSSGVSDEALSANHAQLIGHPGLSVFKSCERIRAVLETGGPSVRRAMPLELRKHADDTISAAQRLQYLLVPSSQAIDEERKFSALSLEDTNINEASAGDRDSTGIRQGVVKQTSVAANTRHHTHLRRGSLDPDHETLVAGEHENESPAQVLKYFTESLQANPKIKQRLLARRFQFLTVLEGVEKATNPNHPANYEEEEGGFGQAFFNLVGLDDSDSSDDEGGGHGGRGGGGGGGCHGGGDNGEESQAVTVTWGELVSRISRFAKSHNFDEDESALIRSHRVMQVK